MTACILTSERLNLRLFEDRDIPFLERMFSDPEVMQYFLGGTRDSVATRRWLARRREHWRRYGRTLYALEQKQGGLVGYCGFIGWEINGVAETEIAYGLVREAWGRGFAVEAAAACRDFAFHECGLSRLIALVHPENAASAKVAQRVGMHLEKRCTVKDVAVDLFALKRPSSDCEPPTSPVK